RGDGRQAKGDWWGWATSPLTSSIADRASVEQVCNQNSPKPAPPTIVWVCSRALLVTPDLSQVRDRSPNEIDLDQAVQANRLVILDIGPGAEPDHPPDRDRTVVEVQPQFGAAVGAGHGEGIADRLADKFAVRVEEVGQSATGTTGPAPNL